jgi:hypothetical protein
MNPALLERTTVGMVLLERTTVGMVLLERTAVGTVSVVPASALPEIFEPIGRQLGVAHRMLDVPMPEIGLQGSRIVPLVGQREAAGVAQHVRVGGESRAWPHRSPVLIEGSGLSGVLWQNSV